MIRQVQLIKMLNPIIKGWALYHRHIVAKESFSRLRYEIYKIIWQWAKRRHSNKSSNWVKNKYFKLIKGDAWKFACIKDKQKPDETPIIYKLVDPTKIPIKRHVKIISDANPYDKQWDEYFEKRLKLKVYKSLSLNGNKQLIILWNKQKGRCPNCKQAITLDIDWDIHHVIPKSKGGNNRSSNLMIMHVNCHKQIHNQRLSVEAGSK